MALSPAERLPRPEEPAVNLCHYLPAHLLHSAAALQWRGRARIVIIRLPPFGELIEIELEA